MPRISEKKVLLENIILDTLFNLLSSHSKAEEDQILDNCLVSYFAISSSRYVGPRDFKIPKSTGWYLNVLPNYDDFRFKSCLRVTREDFQYILLLISNHPVFRRQGNNQLTPIELQLAIALFRFGLNGTGASYYRVGGQFGTSDGGTIRNCTDRVIKAIIGLQQEFINWPSVEERCGIEAFMADKLPKCVGYLDGSHINFYEAPIDDHESYFSRKQLYGIQVQVVCDNNLQIRDLCIGYSASVHDSRVFVNSPLGQTPQTFLTDGQWIAADSAYQLTEFVITPFRENATTGCLAQRRKFNKHFSGYRVKIEQVFGVLKGVFSSLTNLRIRVDKQSGHQRACNWILACCILYNSVRPSINTDDYLAEQNDDENYDEIIGRASVQGEQKRLDLFEWINDL